MMDGMDDLVQWLRAQLARQEGIARRARDADEAADRLFEGHCSPNWTLREVEAKREIIRQHTAMTTKWDTLACSTCHPRPGRPAWPCDTLRLLALPYSDRPGYREEWRP